MAKKNLLIFIVVVVIVVAVVLLSVYFLRQQSRADHLISGVPYNGQYNHFFDFYKLNASSVSAVADVLGYWGDDRFTVNSLKDQLLEGRIASFESIAKFFRSNGYEIYFPDGLGKEQVIEEVKKFVNKEKNVPVIVLQKISIDPNSFCNGSRVIIGIFDKEQKVVTHDHYFGNNYEISYEDFKKMLIYGKQRVLAVWPSEQLKSSLKSPDHSVPYPARLAVMDKVGKIFEKYANATLAGLILNDYPKALPFYEAIVNDPNINEFSPAHVVMFQVDLARAYLALKRTDEAISLLNEKTIPINHDLNAPFGEWTEQLGYKTALKKASAPYFMLGNAYLSKGNKSLARKNFEQGLAISPEHVLSQEVLNQLNAQ